MGGAEAGLLTAVIAGAVSLAVGVPTVIVAFFAARRGAAATENAAKIAATASIIPMLLASDDPEVRQQGQDLLVAFAKQLRGDDPATPSTIRATTRNDELTAAVEGARTVSEQQGRSPTIGYSERGGGGYL